MNKRTRSDASSYHYEAWVVADSNGGLRLTRTQPSAGLGEIAVSLTITVPKALFQRPLLRAAITLPDIPPMAPGDAVQALTDAVERGCDFAVVVSVEEPPK